MSKNQAAFPSPGVVLPDGRGNGMQQGAYEGMSLRDYFAAKAMQEISWARKTLEESAADCYEIADAMLAAREVSK